MRRFKIIFMVFILIIGINSCKKTYDDGHAISLRTKFNRITGKWKLKSIEGVSRLNPEIDQYMELTKDNISGEKYKAVFTNFQEESYWGDKKDSLFTCSGYWEFYEGAYGGCSIMEELQEKEGLRLILQTDSGNTGELWKIKELKNKELVLINYICINYGYYKNSRKLTFEK